MRDLIGELFLNVEMYDSIELATFAKIPIAHNGTKCLIKREGSIIIGQMDAEVSFNGTPIIISSKSTNDWVKTLNNTLIGKQLQVSGSLIYNNGAAYRQVREDAAQGNKANYSIEYVSGESFSASFIPSGLADTLLRGDKVSTNISFLSSATVTRISIG